MRILAVTEKSNVFGLFYGKMQRVAFSLNS